MAKRTLQHTYLLLLLCFGLLVAGIAFYRVKTAAQAKNNTTSQLFLSIVKDVKADALIKKEAGKSGTIDL